MASEHCTDARHFWPDDYQEGDTCNCGAFYVIRSGGNGLIIELAPPPQQEQG